MMEKTYNLIAGKNLDRLAALSDGVFAVAMTLLVLDLHVPKLPETVRTDTALLAALTPVAGGLLPYVMSFVTLGIFWVGQQSQINTFDRSNRDLTWIHIAFLFVVTLLPFSTALLAAYEWSRVAVVAYWFNILLLGAVLYASILYVRRAKLFKPDVSPEIIAAMFRRIVVAQTLYFMAMLICFANTYASIVVTFAVQLIYALAPRVRLLYRL